MAVYHHPFIPFHIAAIHFFSVLLKFIIGFAYKVVPAHYLFVLCLIDPSFSVFKLHYYIRMTNEAHLDLHGSHRVLWVG